MREATWSQTACPDSILEAASQAQRPMLKVGAKEKGTISIPNCSVGKESACNEGDTGRTGSISGWGRVPGV